MPSTLHRRKITRKELKQPDEFTSFLESAQEFFLTNLRQMVISALIIAASAAVVGGIYWSERRQDRIASDQFYAALTALNAKQYKNAERQFAELAISQQRRRVGKLARFYLGCAYLGGNDLEHARQSFVAFVADEHDPTFANLALTNLGVIYERMGDYGKAAGAYRQAASLVGPEQVRAQLGVGRMLTKQGQKDEAVAVYRAFLAAHPFAQQRDEVVESLAMLGATPVAAPPSGNAQAAAPSAAATSSSH